MFFKTLNLFFLLLFLSGFSAFSQETVTITTYYPAPFGVYGKLVTGTLGVGDNSDPDDLGGSDAPNADTESGDVWIQTLGIGTAAPQNILDVAGSVVIGSSYAGAHTAADNSLLVEGNMGVGLTGATPSPQANLEINGTISLIPSGYPTALSGEDVIGTLFYSNVSGDTGLRFRNNDEWVELGSAALGDEFEVDSQDTANFNFVKNNMVANCPSGSVLVGVRLHSAGACPHGCGSETLGSDAFATVGRLKQITAICRRLNR